MLSGGPIIAWHVVCGCRLRQCAFMLHNKRALFQSGCTRLQLRHLLEEHQRPQIISPEAILRYSQQRQVTLQRHTKHSVRHTAHQHNARILTNATKVCGEQLSASLYTARACMDNCKCWFEPSLQNARL